MFQLQHLDLEVKLKELEREEAEEEFSRVDTERLLTKFLTSRRPGLFRVPKHRSKRDPPPSARKAM
ncbi:hypothetical protein RJ639_022305 [Escallonia herrerae]|uniref:Uncharacterized protein n=1 Tax=Escallonia herrerae TaxID=1293975 RepID=A0AA88V6E6_9ASTE|nr:hypothetical protein RJ639_022305 [Escallonia herrerae]